MNTDILVTGKNNYFKQFPLIWELIEGFTKGVSFPVKAKHTQEFDAHNLPIVVLPNAKTISTYYLQIAE